MQISESLYNQMPRELQSLFVRIPNPGKTEVLAAFAKYGDAPGQLRPTGPGFAPKTGTPVYGDYGERPQHNPIGDSGSAARFFTECPFTEDELRFFYTSKASQEERTGSAHPTTKPLSLIVWLMRLITPPGGLVLDPFAGSGTTGVAAKALGMRSILIELEADHVKDIKRRMAAPLPKGGGVKRRSSSNQRTLLDP